MKKIDSYNWRSLEIEFQRIKLNYLKWLFYLTPPTDNVIGCGIGDDFKVFNSKNGWSFSASPSSSQSVPICGRKGVIKTDYYQQCKELENESFKLKESLRKKIGELRKKLKQSIELGDYKAVLEIMENAYWLKIGLHEFVHDNRFNLDKNGKVGKDYRSYVLEQLSRNERVCFSSNIDTRIYTWNSFACCAYDCGPIALGISGYVPYSKVVEQRNKYFSDNINIFKDANQDKKRDIAVDSLSEIYDFILLYHRDPIVKIENYGDFKVHKNLGSSRKKYVTLNQD